MATIIPKLRTRTGEVIGIEQFITPPDLTDNNQTFIATDASSGVSTLTVTDGLKFATSEFAVVGNIGAENAEIIQLNASTTPTATTLTLFAATTTNFAHSKGERVVFIPYNQVIIERSTDGGTSFSTLATINIRVDSLETYNQHTTGATTDLYRAKFSNSSTADVSTVGDAILGSGYVVNSAGAVIRKALESLGEKIDAVLTKEFLFDALNEGRREIDDHEDVEHWSFRTQFELDMGDVIPGQFQIAVPTNLRFPDTYLDILELRIGTDKLPLRQVDKRTMNLNYRGIAHSELDGAITTGSTSIILNSSGDFSDSGAISIASPDISTDIDVVDYTGNTLSTKTLTGVTNITVNHADDIDVWQGASFGLPQQYTVFEDKITFSQPFSNELAGENIWADIYTKITDINSDADELDEPFFQIYIPYLRYRIKARKDPQMIREQDDDYKSWVEKREMQVRKEFTGQDMRIIVDVPDRVFPTDNTGVIR